MPTRKAVIIGPFSRGLNSYDDPTALHDQECAEALNFDPNLDGSLKNRPPFTDTGDSFPVTGIGTPYLLGYYYSASGETSLIASDGDSSTWHYTNGEWSLITDTMSASAMTQFDGKAWLVAPVGSSGNGGSWTPSGGFTAESAMPKGASITSYKSRLWIAHGVGSANPTRISYSKVLGQPDFWTNPPFVDVGSGDGQNIVKIVTYYDVMLVFRTKSIWSFQYSQDPASAIQGVVVPGVGLQSPYSLVAYENYLYFMYDENAYSFINNRAQQINIKVPFRTFNPGATSTPYSVSLFNNRILFSFFENIYVFSLRTQTWTVWRSDAWGPIGQLMMPYTDDETGIAYALPSSRISPPATLSRNRALNPSFKNDTQYWANSTNTTDLERAMRSSETMGRFTLTDTFGQARLNNMPVPPGSSVYVQMKLAVSHETPGTCQGGIRVHYITGGTEGNSSGTIGPTLDSSLETLTEAWTTINFTVPTVPGPAETHLRVYPRIVDGDVGMKILVKEVIWDTSPITGYYDGDTDDEGEKSYRWDGPEGNSPSRELTTANISLLRIEDKVSDAREDMLCILVTKNYNFDIPGAFKVLFWWGIDAIFKTNVQGQVIPGVYNLSTTWGKIFTGGISWENLLSGTWRHPYESNSSVISDVGTGPGPLRKFVKFFKKLRFRQIQFRVTFQTDGSASTAPVQLFTLSTYMTEKQTVSKTVS